MQSETRSQQYIYIGADHGGFALKQALVSWLQQLGHEVSDIGPHTLNPDDDYPTFAMQVAVKLQEWAEPVIRDPQYVGVLICRQGAGMAIVANKYRGLRAAVCRTVEEARLARAHNNANVLVLEGDVVSLDEAMRLWEVFSTTSFDGGRHQRRLEMFAHLGE